MNESINKIFKYSFKGLGINVIAIGILLPFAKVPSILISIFLIPLGVILMTGEASVYLKKKR